MSIPLGNFLLHLLNIISIGKCITTAIHRTQAAQERINNLWCYECNSMDHGPACSDITTLNTTIFAQKCQNNDFLCMVKRFSYTTSTENSTSPPKMWSLDRHCTQSCETGCIIIGERTKLYACTFCCDTSLCNIGTGSAATLFSTPQIKTGIGTLQLSTIYILIIYNFIRNYINSMKSYLNN